MIELLFVTCLATAAADDGPCRERSLLFTDITPMTCMMGAQPELAKWINTHPGQTIKSWKCRVVSFAEHEA
ncbi:hypothetical protein DKT77_01950 [Meridianimarinicoccus roseus]|jgi:hypothetical protein|uniref:Uncharacterized protein n=1 Tax=Meridianimarinicoccus roseus TaxID=2072018 RepID=A0A2V2LF74_9RHOB|nr:hypothetical protein [Meridianimarinicoccus roseus]PWR04278.1 hypothetical protein DKT77_01950 [Meridianimarinicoccus roseus]